MGGSSREQLEGKVKWLEQRMGMLERFVEMRFCETFRDFAIRNQTGGVSKAKDVGNSSFLLRSPPAGEEEEDDCASSGMNVGDSADVEFEEPLLREPETRYSLRKKKKLTTAASRAGDKEVRISIPRVDNIPERSTGAKATSPQKEGEGQVKMEAPEDDSGGAGEADGDYITFSGDENAGGADDDDYIDDPDANPVDPDDTNWSSASSDEESGARPAKRKRKSGSSSKKRPVPSEATETCPYCQKNVRSDLMNKHMKDFHLRERHLQCRFCDKRFFSTERLQKHEKIHQLDKIGKRCRVTNCQSKEMFFVDSFQALKHERFCIRRELEAERPVDEELMENVWRRSKHRKEPLGWPGEEELVKRFMERSKSIRQTPELSAEQIEGILKTVTPSESSTSKWKCTVCEGEQEKLFASKYHLRRHLTNVHGRAGGGGRRRDRRGGNEDGAMEEQDCSAVAEESQGNQG